MYFLRAGAILLGPWLLTLHLPMLNFSMCYEVLCRVGRIGRGGLPDVVQGRFWTTSEHEAKEVEK